MRREVHSAMLSAIEAGKPSEQTIRTRRDVRVDAGTCRLHTSTPSCVVVSEAEKPTVGVEHLADHRLRCIRTRPLTCAVHHHAREDLPRCHAREDLVLEGRDHRSVVPTPDPAHDDGHDLRDLHVLVLRQIERLVEVERDELRSPDELDQVGEKLCLLAHLEVADEVLGNDRGEVGGVPIDVIRAVRLPCPRIVRAANAIHSVVETGDDANTTHSLLSLVLQLLRARSAGNRSGRKSSTSVLVAAPTLRADLELSNALGLRAACAVLLLRRNRGVRLLARRARLTRSVSLRLRELSEAGTRLATAKRGTADGNVLITVLAGHHDQKSSKGGRLVVEQKTGVVKKGMCETVQLFSVLESLLEMGISPFIISIILTILVYRPI